ncbi:magnesium transporter [Desulfosoma caldarium]|uniref:Magnesium transporter MgtE n=1 Tax=Desulfosoma caldarium TaxID=610254 RepID=A0A3N1V187_9BACT|nr:magnesium transporter [Desulfosoma caldarium]ROQ93306.1 magnesium transporter [Desulfosoma caldarium]
MSLQGSPDGLLHEGAITEPWEVVQQALDSVHPADAAVLLAQYKPQDIAHIVEILGPHQVLAAFEFLPFEVQKETLPHLSRDTVVRLISLMRPDERADLVEELDEDFQDQLLSLLIKAERQNLLKLLTYPEESAGAYMTTDYASLKATQTVREALDELRLQAPKKETIYYAYVVDASRHLIGILSLRDLIMARPESTVERIMSRQVISVPVDMDIELVAKEMRHYDFLAMPVVDDENRLVGIITYDDIFDVITEEATEDMYLLASLDTDERISSPIMRSVKLRSPWLFVNLGTALIASYTVSLFSETIAHFVVLASLMPLVAGLGGNAGTQSLTVVVRALALGEIEDRGKWMVVLRQMTVGLFNGALCGALLAMITLAWHHNPWLALIMWLAMIFNMIVAGCLGALVPIILRKLKLDPALGSSIFVTAATDTGGFFFFLGLATLFMDRILTHGV